MKSPLGVMSEVMDADVPALATVMVGFVPPRVMMPPESEYPVTLKSILWTVIPPASTATAPPAFWNTASLSALLFQIVFRGPAGLVAHVMFVTSQLPAPPVGAFQYNETA